MNPFERLDDAHAWSVYARLSQHSNSNSGWRVAGIRVYDDLVSFEQLCRLEVAESTPPASLSFTKFECMLNDHDIRVPRVRRCMMIEHQNTTCEMYAVAWISSGRGRGELGLGPIDKFLEQNRTRSPANDELDAADRMSQALAPVVETLCGDYYPGKFRPTDFARSELDAYHFAN